MKKRIFITGGEGFIGSGLIHALKKRGFETASFDGLLNFIDNASYYKRCLKIRKALFGAPSKKYRGDIRNPRVVERAVKDFRPEVVVHLAGLPMARVSEKHMQDMIPINLDGTLNVIKAFEKSKATRFVYTSSSMAYGHFKQTPQSENFILDPVNLYGACKAAGEYFVKLSQKDWVIIRPTSVYGFADCSNRVSQLLFDAANLKKPVWVVKGETLDFSYIDDVVDGFMRAIIKPKASRETFNISRGEARAATEFAEVLKEYYPGFTYEIRQPTTQQVYRGPQDIEKVRVLLGFSPRYSIEKGIGKIQGLIEQYNFYRNL